VFDKDLFGVDVQPEKQGPGLAAQWEYPPFSVLNAREGWWQERKRQWLALGIKSELGRGSSVTWRVDCDGRSTPTKADNCHLSARAFI